MNIESIVSNGGALVGVLATGWLALKASRTQAKSQTETAGVTTGAQLLTEAVKEWRQISEDAFARAKAAHEKADEVAVELTKERAHSALQDRRISAWSGFYFDLSNRWPHHRLQETPPAPPDVD